MSTSIEVILSAYNNADFVRFALEGYRNQTDDDFSIAIADDGSGPNVLQVAGERADHGLQVRHVWQEDRGWRKARILNRAVATSRADYLVFSDSDCIPSRRFVQDHRRRAREGHFVCGRRVDLGRELTGDLLAGEVSPIRLDSGAWLLGQWLRGRVRKLRYGIRFPEAAARVWRRRRTSALGANLAVWRGDLLRINGFDNDFQGQGFWGGEDSDLDWRLRASGVRPSGLRGRGVVFHLYHPSRAVPGLVSVLEAKKRAGSWHASNGLEQAWDSSPSRP